MSDIFLFNTTTSQVAYWLMNASDATGTVTKLSSHTSNVTAGYFVGAIGDFNSDGLADLVFTSSKSDLYLWTNNGQGGFTLTPLDSYPAGWILIGAGDVDGDGQDDPLWLNPTACQFGYWLMKNGVHTESKTITITCGYYPPSPSGITRHPIAFPCCGPARPKISMCGTAQGTGSPRTRSVPMVRAAPWWPLAVAMKGR